MNLNTSKQAKPTERFDPQSPQGASSSVYHLTFASFVFILGAFGLVFAIAAFTFFGLVDGNFLRVKRLAAQTSPTKEAPAASPDERDPDEEAVKQNYTSMIAANQQHDAEAIVHFISSTAGFVSTKTNMPWADVIREDYENGTSIGMPDAVTPYEQDDALAQPAIYTHSSTEVDDGINEDAITVDYETVDSSAFQNYEDIWVKENGVWKIKSWQKGATYSKADMKNKVFAAYDDMDKAPIDHITKTFAKYLATNYTYTTKTNVTLSAREAEDTINAFAKRHNWGSRSITTGDSHFDGDAKFIVDRQIRVPVQGDKQLQTAQEDTWERSGDDWLLAQTVIQDQGTNLDLAHITNRERPALISAVHRATDSIIASQGNLDKAPLEKAFTDKAFSLMTSRIDGLQSQSLVARLILTNQSFTDIETNSEDSATVKTQETWQIQTFSPSSANTALSALAPLPPQISSGEVIYTLIKQSDGTWIVSDYTDNKTSPTGYSVSE